jgi:hypothetical protein
MLAPSVALPSVRLLIVLGRISRVVGISVKDLDWVTAPVCLRDLRLPRSFTRCWSCSRST